MKFHMDDSAAVFHRISSTRFFTTFEKVSTVFFFVNMEKHKKNELQSEKKSRQQQVKVRRTTESENITRCSLCFAAFLIGFITVAASSTSSFRSLRANYALTCEEMNYRAFAMNERSLLMLRFMSEFDFVVERRNNVNLIFRFLN